MCDAMVRVARWWRLTGWRCIVCGHVSAVRAWLAVSMSGPLGGHSPRVEEQRAQGGRRCGRRATARASRMQPITRSAASSIDGAINGAINGARGMERDGSGSGGTSNHLARDATVAAAAARAKAHENGARGMGASNATVQAKHDATDRWSAASQRARRRQRRSKRRGARAEKHDAAVC